jgi:hypothetical protein
MPIGMDPPIWDAAPIWETWKDLPSPKVGQIKVAAPRLELPPDSVHSEGAAGRIKQGRPETSVPRGWYSSGGSRSSLPPGPRQRVCARGERYFPARRD